MINFDKNLTFMKNSYHMKLYQQVKHLHELLNYPFVKKKYQPRIKAIQ